MGDGKRYQLRKCAGNYWLLDMEQADFAYRPPIAINETGALIIGTYLETEDVGKTAASLSEAYGIDLEEAIQDVRDFLSQLHLTE